MKLEIKHLDETEDCYETKYALLKQIHYRDGEILKLEHINAKHCREIERLQGMLNEEGNSINDLNVEHRNDVATLANRINELEFELNMRNVPAMKESLKSSARLAMKQDDEIKRSCIRPYNSKDTASDDRIDRITELKNLFEYLKAHLIYLSRKEGNQPINPDDIDVKYIEAASRYCFPVLFNNRDEGPSLTHIGGDTKSDKW